ncbi:MAG: hypothetical protein GXO07_05635 [Crenarchaeota archaeon]|nr:hypothetical protein [Thermoproteota archaeon]
MRGQSEVLATLVIAMIVLGALTWLLAQWQAGVGRAVKEINELTRQAEKIAIRIDCTGNYIVFIDPTAPSVTDPAGTNYAKVRFCYAELGDEAYKAYVVVPFTCNGAPGAYFIYGNFTLENVNGLSLYAFHPLGPSAVVPKATCADPTFLPFSSLHVVFPDGSEKVLTCFINTTLVGGSYLWGVASCVGA